MLSILSVMLDDARASRAIETPHRKPSFLAVYGVALLVAGALIFGTLVLRTISEAFQPAYAVSVVATDD
jgi:hypothetical protein